MRVSSIWEFAAKQSVKLRKNIDPVSVVLDSVVSFNKP